MCGQKIEWSGDIFSESGNSYPFVLIIFLNVMHCMAVKSSFWQPFQWKHSCNSCNSLRGFLIFCLKSVFKLFIMAEYKIFWTDNSRVCKITGSVFKPVHTAYFKSFFTLFFKHFLINNIWSGFIRAFNYLFFLCSLFSLYRKNFKCQ